MEGKSSLSAPVAILIAGVIIAGAIVFTNGGGSNSGNVATGGAAATSVPDIKLSKSDHIFGSPDADIIIFEYSDTECPFCKRFHETMTEVMDTYGANGKVAWVYRHFPLVQIHSKAPKEAEATECAAELGGNDGFWNYLNTLMEVTPSNNGLDLAILPDIAEQVGLDRGKFQACLDSGKYASIVDDQYNQGIKDGARGTPHSIAVVKDGENFIISGAQPFINVQSTIEAALAQ